MNKDTVTGKNSYNSLNEIIMRTSDETIYWLMEKGLLKQKQICKECNGEQVLKKTKRNKDLLGWRCYDALCNNFLVWTSIRRGSVFEDFTVDLKEVVKSIYFWSTGMKQSDILIHVELGKMSMLKLKKLLCANIKTYYNENPIILGGPDRLIQVDETMINHKVKAHRGRGPKEQCWVLCIVDCSYSPAKGYACIIKDKSRSTVLPIIKRVVRPGSIIHTDEAKIYNCLGKSENYEHKAIVHKYNFVDYVNNVHTQHVESYNNKMKLRIKALKGVKDKAREEFLNEFMWLDNYSEGCFEKTLDLLK